MGRRGFRKGKRKMEYKILNVEELKELGKDCGGFLTKSERKAEFDRWQYRDNSYNWDWQNAYCYLMEIRGREDGLTLVWLAENSNTDPRCADYAEENCVVFREWGDFAEFIGELLSRQEDEEEEDEKAVAY